MTSERSEKRERYAEPDLTAFAPRRLIQAVEFPYDASDKFWFSAAGTVVAPEAEDWAHRAARAIMSDIAGRSKHFAVNKNSEDQRRQQVALIAEIIRRAKQEDPVELGGRADG